MDVYVERLYATLTDALRRSRRSFEAPVTVAEIYQDLVPYRVVRSAIGFELNADYEHALLQLLAGVDNLTRLDPESAAAELREELATPNPNVGLFRKFAACDVWIAPPADALDAEEASPAPEWASAEEERFAPEPVEDEATGVERALSDLTSVRNVREERRRDDDVTMSRDATGGHEHAGAGGSAKPGREASPSDASGARDTMRRCGFCDAKLPAGRLVRFCPQCGGDQTRRPCVACGEALETGWRYCVTCGAPQRQGGTA